jgi:hypothetical protein
MPDSNTITLDVAVMCQEYSPVELTCIDNHIINLDEILVTEDLFKHIFYPYGENFGLDSTLCRMPDIHKYVTFLPTFRSISGEPFSLLEQIILNIEADLNVTRNCFTTNTLIELSKELSGIKTLYDINCCNIMCSLTWSNIMSIIRNEYVSSKHPLNQVLLIISIVFKTPNNAILPTIVKFRYRMNINTNWLNNNNN